MISTVGQASITEALRLAGSRSAGFAEIPEWFGQDHNAYVESLSQRLRSEFEVGEMTKLLRDEFEIDWLTLHYITRHPVTPGSTRTENIHTRVPVAPYMRHHEKEVTVYERGLSPYIQFFAEEASRTGTPRSVLFGEMDHSMEGLSNQWLFVRRGLTDCLVRITEGSEFQGNVTSDEVAELQQVDPTGVDAVLAVLRVWANVRDLSPEAGFGLLRDACRATLLGLKAGVFELPRSAFLAPVYVQANFVGGLAYLGRSQIDEGGIAALGLLGRTLLTGIRLVEEQQREANIQQIELLSKARAEFVQRMAHSIHDPLGALLSTVESAVKGLGGVKEAVDRLRDASSKLIVTFAKSDVEELLVIKPAEFNLRNLIDTVTFTQSNAYAQAGINLEVDPIPEDWTVQLDKRGFLEVMDTLLGNALRYARKLVTIRVERTDDDRHYVFHVRDDGPGVAPQILDRLFQPGVRAEGDSSSGHGYGLYFARLIIEGHGGKIRISPDTDSGAEFEVQIPTVFKQQS